MPELSANITQMNATVHIFWICSVAFLQELKLVDNSQAKRAFMAKLVVFFVARLLSSAQGLVTNYFSGRIREVTCHCVTGSDTSH